MNPIWRIKERLGLRSPGYPCKCGGKMPEVEYHTTVYCTDNVQQYFGIIDRHNPPPPSERWKGDELPLTD